jgi:hypothetical protein
MTDGVRQGMEKKKKIHWEGVEPPPLAWKARMITVSPPV